MFSSLKSPRKIHNIIYYFIFWGVNLMVLPFLFNCDNVSHSLAEWYCIDYWQMSRNIDCLHSLISKSIMSIQIFVLPYLFRSNQGLCHGKFSEKQRTNSLSSLDKASHVKYNCFKHFTWYGKVFCFHNEPFNSTLNSFSPKFNAFTFARRNGKYMSLT